MRIIAIGDIHGKTNWKAIVEKETFDMVVFIGDYFDDYKKTSGARQIHNFKDIIAFKEANINSVMLLIGNHDYHYMKRVNAQYSGYQPWYRTDIQEVLESALDKELLQMCYVYEHFLFTHAGVAAPWLNSFNHQEVHSLNIASIINTAFKEHPEYFRFTSGRTFSQTGDDICQTPIWIRPGSLRQAGINGFVQVVGHTEKKHVIIEDKIILIDALAAGEYLIINNGVSTIGKIINE